MSKTKYRRADVYINPDVHPFVTAHYDTCKEFNDKFSRKLLDAAESWWRQEYESVIHNRIENKLIKQE
jgi:hypothetical protein